MANTNNHVGNTSSTVVNNTHEYNGLDKSKGDNLIFAVPVVYEVGMAVTAAIAVYLQANPDVAASIYDTLSGSAENAGRTLNEMLTIDPKLTDKELDVQAVVVSSLLKDLEDQSRSTEDKLEIYRLIDGYDPKAVELAKERAKAISPNTGGNQIPDPLPMPSGSEIKDPEVIVFENPEADKLDSTTVTPISEEQGATILENPADTDVDPLLVVTSESYIPAPKNINGISGLTIAKSKTSVQGGGKLRRRWKDSKGNIYEWNYQHGEVEKYNKRGKHLGQFNPETGEQTKPADKTRKVEP